ncbi:hypothetical protein [Fodinicola acaciae]|uniref:hypothetical protein n=1 Tax=Fodinicola acaciae TaxID=2681555 RepID=UPI0013D5E103|nr:hypothetical protein [Fodinicola acaciae]
MRISVLRRAALLVAVLAALATAGFSATPASAAVTFSHPAPGLTLAVTPVPHGVEPMSISPTCGADPRLDFLVWTTMGGSWYCFSGHGSYNAGLFDVQMWATYGTDGGQFTYGSGNGFCQPVTFFGPGDHNGALSQARICNISLY